MSSRNKPLMYTQRIYATAGDAVISPLCFPSYSFFFFCPSSARNTYLCASKPLPVWQGNWRGQEHPEPHRKRRHFHCRDLHMARASHQVPHLVQNTLHFVCSPSHCCRRVVFQRQCSQAHLADATAIPDTSQPPRERGFTLVAPAAVTGMHKHAGDGDWGSGQGPCSSQGSSSCRKALDSPWLHSVEGQRLLSSDRRAPGKYCQILSVCKTLSLLFNCLKLMV